MRAPRTHLALGAGLLLAGAAGLLAHDYLQGNTSAHVEREIMIMRTTLARSAARALLDDPPDIGMNEENFAGTFAGLLAQKAGDLFTVTSHGQPLAPRAVKVQLTEELDVEFELTYPRPPDGPLVLQARYIKRMDDGHMNRLELLVSRKFIEWVDLSIDEDTYATVLAPPPPGALGPPATVLPSRPAGEPSLPVPAPPANGPTPLAAASSARPPPESWPVAATRPPAPAAGPDRRGMWATGALLLAILVGLALSRRRPRAAPGEPSA